MDPAISWISPYYRRDLSLKHFPMLQYENLKQVQATTTNAIDLNATEAGIILLSLNKVIDTKVC